MHWPSLHRLSRLQEHMASGAAGSTTEVEHGVPPGTILYTQLETNISGDPKKAQGFGRVSRTQPEKFSPDQHEAIAEFFHREGYAVIIGAMSQDEVGHLNDFFVRTQRSNPTAWGLGDVREGYHKNQGMIYSQPLLDHPELDKYTRHRGNYQVVCDLMGGDDKPRFAEFNFREAP